MKRSKTLAAVLLSGSMVGASWAASADPQFRESITVRGHVSGMAAEHRLTFSGPVALPGVSLAAGTYLFRRPAANVLQVRRADTGEPLAMVSTIPATRARSDTYEIVLGTAQTSGAPRRLEAWFAPGESTGQQLIHRNR